jgi:hypothetical protein
LAAFRTSADFSALATGLNQLHQRHVGRIARARLHLEDARIAAGARLEARPEIAEQLLTTLTSRSRETPGGGATSVSILASVINGSTTRRSSLALGTVVRMVSCRSSEVAMLRNIAWRCEELRDS